MFPIFTNTNNPEFHLLCDKFLEETKWLRRDLALSTPVHKLFPQKLYMTMSNMERLIDLLNKKSSFNISINRQILSLVKVLLWVLKGSYSIIFLLLYNYLKKLHKYGCDFETSKEYFLLPTDPQFIGNTRYKPYYDYYRYHNIYMNATTPGKVIIHNLMLGVMNPKRPTSYNEFCDLQIFSKAINQKIRAAPDSYFSMFMLSIAIFLYTSYLALLRKKISLERCISQAETSKTAMTILTQVMKSLHQLTGNVYGKDLEIIYQIMIKKELTPLDRSKDILERILPKGELIKIKQLIKNCKPYSRSLFTGTILLTAALLNLATYNLQKVIYTNELLILELAKLMLIIIWI